MSNLGIKQASAAAITVLIVVVTMNGCDGTTPLSNCGVTGATQACLCGILTGSQMCETTGAWSPCMCEPCASGMTRACDCGAAAGTQICSGEGWQSCECGDAGIPLTSDGGPCPPGPIEVVPGRVIPEPFGLDYTGLDEPVPGTGYDARREALLAGTRCVDIVEESPSTAPAAELGCSPDVIAATVNERFYRSYEEFAQGQRIGFGARASGPLGAWSGDAYANYISSSRSSVENVYLLVEAIVQVRPMNRTYRLSEEAVCMLRADPTGSLFTERCGDRFVANVRRGATFRAVLRGRSSVAETESVIRAGARGSYGSFAVSGDFAQDVRAFAQSFGIEMSVVQVGGIAMPVSDDPEELIARAQSFLCEVTTETSVVTGVNFDHYARAGAPLDVLAPVEGDTIAAYERLSELYNAVSERRRVVEWLRRQHSTEWRLIECTDIATAYQDKLRQLDTALASVEAAFEDCRTLRDVPCVVPSIDLVELESLPPILDDVCRGIACTGFSEPGGGRDVFGICTRCVISPSTLPTIRYSDSGGVEFACSGMLPTARVHVNLGSRYVVQSPTGVGCGTDILGIEASLSGTGQPTVGFSRTSWSSGTIDYCGSGMRPNTSPAYTADGYANGFVGTDGISRVRLFPSAAGSCGRTCCVNDTGSAWTNGRCDFVSMALSVCEGSGC